MDHFPKIGMKTKIIWNHHLDWYHWYIDSTHKVISLHMGVISFHLGVMMLCLHWPAPFFSLNRSHSQRKATLSHYGSKRCRPGQRGCFQACMGLPQSPETSPETTLKNTKTQVTGSFSHIFPLDLCQSFPLHHFGASQSNSLVWISSLWHSERS